MFQSVITVLITIGSVLLFGYWFRYTCVLIQTAKTSRYYVSEFASANSLSLMQVQNDFFKSEPAQLELLSTMLDRDYEKLKPLLSRQAAIEDRMLQINYRLTRIMFRTMGRISPTVAKRTLEEMLGTLAHLANSLGERGTSVCGAA